MQIRHSITSAVKLPENLGYDVSNLGGVDRTFKRISLRSFIEASFIIPSFSALTVCGKIHVLPWLVFTVQLTSKNEALQACIVFM
jgi:hypothetical protein